MIYEILYKISGVQRLKIIKAIDKADAIVFLWQQLEADLILNDNNAQYTEAVIVKEESEDEDN